MGTEDWAAYRGRKIILPEMLTETVKEIRSYGNTIATLNGSFDLLHSGHLFMFYEASLAADILIVALNSDASIKAYKSSYRPIIPLQNRLEMVSALECVDYVTWFEETDPRALLSIIQPDVHVNGEEYGENCIEAATVKAYGGNLKLVPRLPGLATSSIIKTIQALPCD